MNSIFTLVYLLITFACVIIVAYIITPIFLPDPKKLKINSKYGIVHPKGLKDYLENIYNGGHPISINTQDSKPRDATSECIQEMISVKNLDHNYNPSALNKAPYSIKSSLRYFNFIWETAPDNILNLYETARNTTVTWPPKYDQKYRLLAFPYVSGNILSGLYQTLANKSSVATMPSWYISKYDPINYNNSLYNKIYDSNIVYSKSLKTIPYQYKLLKTFFGDVVEYETIPALINYINSPKEDNLYLGKYKTGGYILKVDYDKLLSQKPGSKWDEIPIKPEPKRTYYNNYYLEVQHTCYPIPGSDYPLCDDGSWWTYLSVGSGIYWNADRPIICKNKLHLLHCCGWTIDQFVDITANFGGGDGLVNAVFRAIYNNEHPNNPKPAVGLGFRIMQGTNGDMVVKKFFLNMILFFFIIIYLIILIFKDLFELFKGLNDKSNVVIKSTLITIYMVIIFTLIWYLIYTALNDFFKGLGWRTLDMALEETNMTPHQFFEEAIHGTESNPICNGINMTEWFDGFLYDAVYKKGFTSAIMTMQPNKSGCWMVEMFDVVSYVNHIGMKPRLGICGQQLLHSGIQKYDKNNSTNYIPQIMGTIPSNHNCGKSLEEESNCEENLNDSGKICNIYGCRDTNHALCMSCDAVPLSNICVSNKKINYGS